MTKAKDGRKLRNQTIGALAEASRQRPPEDPCALKVLQLMQKGVNGNEESGSDQTLKLADYNGDEAAANKAKRSSLRGSRRMTLGGKDAKEVFKTAVSRLTQVKRLSSVQNQRQEDFRVAESWNHELQMPAARNNAELCQRFWAEMKGRINRRYGSINDCFRAVDTSGDGAISFLEFADMLRVVHFPLDMRVARAMFEKASCGDRELSLDELKALLMEKTLQKMQKHFSGFNNRQLRVRRHVNQFFKCLAQGSQTTMIRCVDRLQRKLTVAFCREFWNMLREHLAKIHSDGDLERSAFAQVVQGAIGSHFMAYEMTFLLRIFDRIDRQKNGRIHLRDLMTTLVLISEENSKENKLGFLFEVFDTDFDGCLLYDQILDMTRCICSHRPIVEESTVPQASKADSISSFQEELTAQDGQRLYECLFWYLKRTTKLDSDIVTWKELWRAFEEQPQVGDALMPGLFRIQWVLEPSPGEPDDDLAALDQHSSGHTCSIAVAASGSTAERGVQRRAVARPDEEAGFRINMVSSSEHRGAVSSALSLKEESERATRAAIRATFGKPKPEVQSVAAWEKSPRETTSLFKKRVTNRFMSSLRTSGDVRYTELSEGFRIADELAVGGPRSIEAAQDTVDDPDDAARPASPASIQGGRPGSSPVAPGSKGLGASKGVATMPRVNSAPTGLLEKPRASQLAASASAGALGGDAIRLPTSAELPSISSQRWGLEAADRFRLFSKVKSGKDNKRHLMGSCGHQDGMGGPAYKCQVCQRQHMIVASF